MQPACHLWLRGPRLLLLLLLLLRLHRPTTQLPGQQLCQHASLLLHP
jgi:hypothetical protein